MATLRSTSTGSQSSLETLISHREQQTSEPTEREALILKELPPLPHLEGTIADLPTGQKDHITLKPVSPEDTTSQSIAYIVAGFFAGVVITISHHFFLAFLNDRNIDDYPQYWVKNANNAFSALFSICIAFVATCALIQMKWNAARSKPLSIKSVDNLFALPSPVALFTTVTSTRLRSLRTFLIPIITAVFIQSLALVSVFAPNALTVTPSAEMSRDILVPTLDLSQVPVEWMNMSIHNTSYSFISSPTWFTILSSIVVQPPLLSWKIPPGCGAKCYFDLVYEGPGLHCMDTPSEPLPYPRKNETTLVYSATSNFYPDRVSDPNSTFHQELRISYIATDYLGVNIERDRGSVHCVFRNAKYNASFQAENNRIEVSQSIQSYGDLVPGSGHVSDCDPYPHIPPCFNNGLNTYTMSNVFATALTGQIRSLAHFGEPDSETTGGINLAMTGLLFSHSPRDLTTGFRLAVPNLSEGLVRLFSGFTLAAIPQQNATTTVQAQVWDGGYAWSYTVWILWAVYLPTLLLASLVSINGLLSIQSNQRGMDEKFSNFLLATRSAELDEVCIDAADFEQLRLLYREEEGTFSVVSVPSEGVV